MASIFILVAALLFATIWFLRFASILLLVLLSSWLLSMLLYCRGNLLVLRRTVRSLLAFIYNLRCFMSSPLNRCGSSLSCMLIKVLADNLVPRRVSVLLIVKTMLLIHVWIPVARILLLIGRPRCTRRNRAAIPLVPAPTLLLPSVPPVLSPAGWCICVPAAEIDGRLAVVTNGHPQHKKRHSCRFDKTPRTVVPEARIPVIILIDPVHAVIKEIISIHLWGIINRISRYRV